MRSNPLRTAFFACIFSLAAPLGVTGCGDDQVPPDPPLEPTYETVENIVRQSCTFSGSCHGGTAAGRGRLNFQRVFDDHRPITDVLFEVPSCEYDRFARVKPGFPEESWLWIKIDHEADARGKLLFTPADDWDAGVRRVGDGGLASSTCPLVAGGQLSFGQLMPMGSRAGISANRRKAIYEWILAGAPGPGGVVTMRDGGADLGPRDSGVSDGGDLGVSDMDVVDGAPLDGSAADAAVFDAGATDAGSTGGGVPSGRR